MKEILKLGFYVLVSGVLLAIFFGVRALIIVITKRVKSD